MTPPDIDATADTIAREVCDATGGYPNIKAARIVAAALLAERTRNAEKAADAARAIAHQVNDQTIAAVFDLPERIRAGK